MKRNEMVVLTCFLSLLVISVTSAQNANDYRSAASGSWGATATWERYSGTQWEAATGTPDSGVGEITIQAGHTVTIDANLVVDSVQVLGNGHVVVDAGVTVVVPLNGNFKGIDVDTTGTVTVGGTIVCRGTLSGSIGSFVFQNASVYEHALNGGSVPRAVWEDGSTMKLTGITGNNPDNTNQDFYNLEIDNPNQVSNLNLGMTGNTIRGSIIVHQTGPSNRYYLTSPTAFVDPITTLGDIVVTGGAFSTNGSSSQAHIIVHSYGDVFVTGGNFGCSRGSGTSVSWYLHGDTISISNATLQNSTSSNQRLQKFIFAKQGTQALSLSNVSYGGSGTSPITFQVSAGATLDLGTSVISNNSTGSFILDSGATLVTSQNNTGSSGSIECVADYGGSNSFVNVIALSGRGTVSVTATGGPHPNAYDTSKSLHRFWTIQADAGITQADMTFYYHDLPWAAISEVRGSESSYKVLRYAGQGNNWYTDSSGIVDAFLDFVTATGVTTVSGVWTVGEPTPTPPVGVAESTSEIPDAFFVEQNFPNPFNPATSITFGLPEAGHVTATVYDMLGRNVATLVDEAREAGTHTVQFDGSRLTSGMYIYRVSSEHGISIRRMILMK